MKAWWSTASLREKRAVCALSAFIALCLAYELIFAPVLDGVDSLRQTIRKDQTTLALLRDSDQRIQELEKSQQPSAPKSSASLLGTIQNDVNNQPIGKSISQLQQAENDSIQMHLQKVNFDQLCKWLIDICQAQGLVIAEMVVTPGDQPGIVDVELKLHAG
jgi:general secretion pathway protein M